MRDPSNEFYKAAEPLRNLQFLEELEHNPNISQRELSHKFGIALGVANACLKKMARRGWIKIKKLPPRRIGYYLTPHGFAEKTKLACRFLSNTIRQYSRTKEDIARKLLGLEKGGAKRIVFYGMSDEMEIAYITLQGASMELVGIVDDDPAKRNVRFFDLPVDSPHAMLRWNPDAVLITSVEARDRIRRQLESQWGPPSFKIESL